MLDAGSLELFELLFRHGVRQTPTARPRRASGGAWCGAGPDPGDLCVMPQPQRMLSVQAMLVRVGFLIFTRGPLALESSPKQGVTHG